jgi:hypothetical protein
VDIRVIQGSCLQWVGKSYTEIKELRLYEEVGGFIITYRSMAVIMVTMIN